MVNSEDFIKRLEKIMGYYDIPASTFADRIKVQRSSISHLLSGRNKPSLEFVLKVIKTYPEVNLYWLLNGKGTFPHPSKNKASTPTAIEKPLEEGPKTHMPQEKKIEKIIIFYTDGSFKSYRE